MTIRSLGCGASAIIKAFRMGREDHCKKGFFNPAGYDPAGFKW